VSAALAGIACAGVLAAPPLPAEAANPASATVIVDAAFRLGGRNFFYNQPLTPNARPYELYAAPMVHAGVELYPAATSRFAVLRDLGAFVTVDQLVGPGSRSVEGVTLETRWTRVEGGMRLRIAPLARRDRLVLGLRGSFVVQPFSLRSGTALDAQAPSVDYTAVRGGGDVRVGIGPLALELSGGFQRLVTAGETRARFRLPEAMGMDLGFGVLVPIARGFEARLVASYDRYFYAFHPEPGDPYIAGGAVDQMFGLRLGAAWSH